MQTKAANDGPFPGRPRGQQPSLGNPWSHQGNSRYPERNPGRLSPAHSPGVDGGRGAQWSASDDHGGVIFFKQFSGKEGETDTNNCTVKNSGVSVGEDNVDRAVSHGDGDYSEYTSGDPEEDESASEGPVTVARDRWHTFLAVLAFSVTSLIPKLCPYLINKVLLIRRHYTKKKKHIAGDSNASSSGTKSAGNCTVLDMCTMSASKLSSHSMGSQGIVSGSRPLSSAEGVTEILLSTQLRHAPTRPAPPPIVEGMTILRGTFYTMPEDESDDKDHNGDSPVTSCVVMVEVH